MKRGCRRFASALRCRSPEQLARWRVDVRLRSATLVAWLIAATPAWTQEESPLRSWAQMDESPYRLTSRVVVTWTGARDKDSRHSERAFSQGEGRFLLAFESGELAQVDVGQARVLWWADAVPVGAVTVLRPVRPPRSVGSVVAHQERLVFLFPDGHRLRLGAGDPLVGRFERSQLEEVLPSYRDWAATYRPDTAWMAELGAQLVDREPQILVFLGSWCVACERFVPRILALAERLDGLGAAVVFVGVSPTEDGVRDPEVVRWGIDRLPAAVVLEQGREVGRLVGPDAFRRPERSLARLLVQP